jgi:WD40 repeat protein
MTLPLALLLALPLVAIPTVDDPPPEPERLLESVGKVRAFQVVAKGRRMLVLASKLELWDLKGPKLLAERGSQAAVLGGFVDFGVDPKEKRLVVAEGIGAVQFDLKALEGSSGAVGGLTVEPVTCLAMDPKGRHVFVGHRKGVVSRLNPPNIQAARKATLPGGDITALALDPKGKRLAVGADDGAVRFLDANSCKWKDSLEQHPEGITALAFDPKGKQLASGCEDGKLRLWDPARVKLKATLEHDSNPINALAWNPSGTQLACAYRSGTVVIWNVNKGEVELELEAPGVGRPTHLAFSKNGKALLLSGVGRGVLRWEL